MTHDDDGRTPRGGGPVPSPARRVASRRGEPPAYVSPYARSGGSHVGPGHAPPRAQARSSQRGGGPAGRAGSARYLGGRATIQTLGRKRRSRTPLVLCLALLLAGGAAGGWWLMSRPASVLLSASPDDARITVRGARSDDSGGFPGSASGTGTLEVGRLQPGTYRLTIERAGFVSTKASVRLTNGGLLEKRYTLEPLPFQMSFTSHPAGAVVSLTRGGGAPLTGITPCTLTFPAGRVAVALTKTGFNRFDKAVFLDSAAAFDFALDPEGQLVHGVGMVACAGAPKGVALTPNGREAWSAILNGPPSIQICDPGTGRLTGSIDLGKSGAVEVIFNRAGTRAYASQMETKLHETSRVFEIDVATRAVLRSIDTASTMTKVIALSPDEKTLYTANWAGNDVSVIDLSTGRVRDRIPVAKTPRGLWPTADGKSLYVAGFDDGDLERIDVSTGRVTRLFQSHGAMRHLVADEKRGLLYTSDMGKDVVWVLDMKTDKVTKLCSTDHKPNTIDLSPDGRVLFVSNRGANNPRSYYLPGYEWGSILLYDTATGKPLDAIVGGNQCTALDVSADGGTLVFSDFLDDRLRVYRVPSYAVLAKGGGGRYAAHFADIKKATPGRAKSTGTAD